MRDGLMFKNSYEMNSDIFSYSTNSKGTNCVKLEQ